MTQTPLQAGLHYNIPARVYHADPAPKPSLNSGIVRTLCEKTPAHAWLQHPRLGGKAREQTDAMAFGAYLHALMAGDVSEFEVCEFADYKSKAAQLYRQEVRRAGRVPIFQHVAEEVGIVAEALTARSAHGCTNTPFASNAQSEVTAIWQEDDIWLRARFDRLVVDVDSYADIWDWKTTSGGLSERELQRTIISYGYHIQAAHYLRGLEATMPHMRGRCSFIFSFVETEPPYCVRRVVLSPELLKHGQRELARAIALWRECMATNTWPGYAAETLTVELPSYLEDDDQISPS